MKEEAEDYQGKTTSQPANDSWAGEDQGAGRHKGIVVWIVVSVFFLIVWALFWRSSLKIALNGYSRRTLMAAGICLIASVVLWICQLLIRKRNFTEKNSLDISGTGDAEKHSAGKIHNHKISLIIGRITFWLIMAAGCAGIIWSAVPYHGWLSWKVDDFLHSKRVAFTHNNLYTDGIQGILIDAEAAWKEELPENIHICNVQLVDYDKDGTVTFVKLAFEGTKQDGSSYRWDIEQDGTVLAVRRMEVEDTASLETSDAMLMQPLLDLSAAMDLEETSEAYSDSYDVKHLELVYEGYRSFMSNADTYWVSSNGTRTPAGEYETCEGYEISIHSSGEGVAEPARYFADWIGSENYVSTEEEAAAEEQETLDEQRTDEEQQGRSYTDPADGTVYCYIDDDTGWRLVIVDAAAGSRFYSMERTEDGGQNWEEINRDPFGGDAGTAEGIVFRDEEYGYIGLSTASADSSTLYVTWDGGTTFTEVELPKDTVPSEDWTIDFDPDATADDYDYMQMPVFEEGRTYIDISWDLYDSYGNWVRFVSDDAGRTWQYETHYDASSVKEELSQ